MKRAASVVCILLLLTLCSGVLAAGKVQVRIPEGFVDLTGGVPAALAGKLPPAIEQQARSGGYLAYAVDLDHPTDGVLANLVATEQQGQMPDLSKSSSPPDEFTQGLAKVYPPGTTLNVVSMNSVSVGSFHGTRILVDAQLPAVALKQLMYLLPAGEQTLSLVYTAPRASYAAYEPLFDASAHATTGLTNPSNAILSMIPAIASGIGAAVIATLVAARKKKKAA
jgi:hypothetical protein